MNSLSQKATAFLCQLRIKVCLLLVTLRGGPLLMTSSLSGFVIGAEFMVLSSTRVCEHMCHARWRQWGLVNVVLTKLLTEPLCRNCGFAFRGFFSLLLCSMVSPDFTRSVRVWFLPNAELISKHDTHWLCAEEDNSIVLMCCVRIRQLSSLAAGSGPRAQRSADPIQQHVGKATNPKLHSTVPCQIETTQLRAARCFHK